MILSAHAKSQFCFFLPPVATGDEGECRGSHEILLTDQSGFISAHLDTSSQVGTQTCPWRVRVRRGQRVMLKLFKFGSVVQPPQEEDGPNGQQTGAAPGYPGGRSNVCYELATVTEGEQERSITTCSGEERESIVYQSDSSMIDISVLSSGSFLLYYEGEYRGKLYCNVFWKILTKIAKM